MIAFINGMVAETGKDYVVLEQQGIGYLVYTPANVPTMVAEGELIKLHTYLHVREDVMQLFGFLRKSDLDMFKLLITVSGIGPKGALGVLSVLDANDLKFAILSGDAKTIATAPGIGKKTAEKTVLELKDKVKLEDAFEERLEAMSEKNTDSLQQVRQDASEALVALGYSQTEALKAIRKVDGAKDMDVETLLKAALKHL
ncbi:MAG: Holliday junction branch migration protein RuvA [Lachnospiraceae bacterium]|jgi:Holliday junction DNA helicase RuvA|nr:Holliday junction branch migration protein RuvA [Lachnospiraceae bacterium]MCR4803417.1 Holliday junction branch migration protein RuvA [Lachnospiraceae bacterium]